MPLLLCPNCQTGMKEVERSGVQLDLCPQCRGVWLDRGELEKILDEVREAKEEARAEREQQEQYRMAEEERARSQKGEPPRAQQIEPPREKSIDQGRGPGERATDRVEEYRESRDREKQYEPASRKGYQHDRESLEYSSNVQRPDVRYPNRRKSFFDRFEDIFG